MGRRVSGAYKIPNSVVDFPLCFQILQRPRRQGRRVAISAHRVIQRARFRRQRVSFLRVESAVRRRFPHAFAQRGFGGGGG